MVIIVLDMLKKGIFFCKNRFTTSSLQAFIIIGVDGYSSILFLTFITGGTSKSGKRVKRAIHPNHRPAGDMQDDGDTIIVGKSEEVLND